MHVYPTWGDFFVVILFLFLFSFVLEDAPVVLLCCVGLDLLILGTSDKWVEAHRFELCSLGSTVALLTLFYFIFLKKGIHVSPVNKRVSWIQFGLPYYQIGLVWGCSNQSCTLYSTVDPLNIIQLKFYLNLDPT